MAENRGDVPINLKLFYSLGTKCDLISLQIKVVDRTRYKKVYEDIMKKLDRLENDYLPQVSLAQKEVSGRYIYIYIYHK